MVVGKLNLMSFVYLLVLPGSLIIKPLIGFYLISFIYHSQARYVGCIPLGIDIPEEEQGEVEEVLHQLNCFPVFLQEDVLKKHYHGFCKKILWPVLHNSINLYLV